MRLRYQMRGLGIGIIVTALLMGVAGGDKIPLSDAEIRARAMELGMVESDSLKLSDIPNMTGESVSDGNVTPQTETEEPSTPEEGSAESESGESSSGESGVEPPAEEEDAPQPDNPEVSGQEAQDSGTVTIVIESGATSYSVCQELARLGLVEDASGFDDYLCGMGYSRSVREGTFEIQKGASQEEIAGIITGKR